MVIYTDWISAADLPLSSYSNFCTLGPFVCQFTAVIAVVHYKLCAIVVPWRFQLVFVEYALSSYRQVVVCKTV
jgi:hypothetical protein